MKLKTILTVLLVGLPLSLHAATLNCGFTTGSGNQLLTTNGGSESELFADVAAMGGNEVKYTFPAGTKKFARLRLTGP